MLISFLKPAESEGNSVGGTPLKPKKKPCDYQRVGFECNKVFIKHFHVTQIQYGMHLLFRILQASDTFFSLSGVVL